MNHPLKHLAACTLAVVASLGATAALSGCGGSSSEPPTTVSARGEAVDRTTQQLTLGNLKYANGTYASCQSHTDGDLWGLTISNGAGMPNAPISVVQGDTSCQLTLTQLVADHTYGTTSPIALTNTYPGAASPFTFGGNTYFYATAELNSATYSNNFIVTIPFSDDPTNVGGTSVLASYVTVSATSSGQSVPSPDYTLDVSGLTVTISSLNVVQNASGNAVLNPGSHTAGSYFVDTTDVLTAAWPNPTFGQLDAAYNGASHSLIANSMAVSIPASAFGLTANGGAALPVTRTIVIHRAVNFVPSYEAFAVTFNHP